MADEPVNVPANFTIARSAGSSGNLNDFDIIDLNDIFSGNYYYTRISIFKITT